MLACLSHIQIKLTHVPPEVQTTAVHPTDMAPLFIHHVQVLNVSHKELQEIRRHEHVCTANRLSEARPTSGPVTKSGLDLGCIAIGKNSFGGWWPWAATDRLSSGPRALGSPRIQGPNKA